MACIKAECSESPHPQALPWRQVVMVSWFGFCFLVSDISDEDGVVGDIFLLILFKHVGRRNGQDAAIIAEAQRCNTCGVSESSNSLSILDCPVLNSDSVDYWDTVMRDPSYYHTLQRGKEIYKYGVGGVGVAVQNAPNLLCMWMTSHPKSVLSNEWVWQC